MYIYIYIYILHSLWRVVEREVCTNKPFSQLYVMHYIYMSGDLLPGSGQVLHLRPGWQRPRYRNAGVCVCVCRCVCVCKSCFASLLCMYMYIHIHIYIHICIYGIYIYVARKLARSWDLAEWKGRRVPLVTQDRKITNIRSAGLKLSITSALKKNGGECGPLG
jgi:hypothetical protein